MDNNDALLLDISNEIISSLNGHARETLISMDYGPEKIAYNKFYGPKVMTKNRYLFLLYLARHVRLFSSLGQKHENVIYFSVSNLEKVANYNGFKPEKIDYERTRAIKHFLAYEQEGLVTHIEEGIASKKEPKKLRKSFHFTLTKEGERHCKEILDNLIAALPKERSAVYRNSAYIQSLKTSTVTNEGYIDYINRRESTFLSFSEYMCRAEIEPIMKYKKFFGRNEEMRKLFDFLGGDNKFMIISGESGIGKTRLCLEFALQMQNEINTSKVNFIHPYREFVPVQFDRRTLLILDDAAKYQELDKSIDFVLNPPAGNEIKMLITVTPLFRDLIMNSIKEKNYQPKTITLGEGDIVSFLEDNFQWIDKGIATLIAGQCRNSFIYALACAEYWKEKGEPKELKDILSWRKEKYIKNISEKTGCDVEDITYAIDLISLTMPLDWIADSKFLRKILSNQKFCTLENILKEASFVFYEDSLFLLEDDLIVIKPDPIADYLRLDAFKNSKMKLILKQLIQYIPYRISYNIIVAIRFDKEVKEDVNRFLLNIWEELNIRKGVYPEYLLALDFLVDLEIPLRGYKKSNISIWLNAFEVIYRNYPSAYWLKSRMAATIFNFYKLCATHRYLEQMEEALDGLKQFYGKYPEFFTILSLALADVITYYAESKGFKKLEVYLEELRAIYAVHPDEMGVLLAHGLLNAYVGRKNHDITLRPKILNDYLKQLRQIYQVYQEEEISKCLAGLLVNAISVSITYSGGERIVEYLLEMRQIYKKFPYAVKNLLAAGLLKYREYVGEERFRSTVDNSEELENIIKEYCLPFKIWKSDLSPEEQHELWSTASDYDLTTINLGYKSEFVIAVDDLRRPENTDPYSEVYTETHDAIFQKHVFLHVNILYENISIKDLHIIICPLRIKHDDHYRSIIDKIIEETKDPILSEFSTKKTEIILTDRRGLSILQNMRLDLDQKKYQLELGYSMATTISSELGRLSAYVEIVEDEHVEIHPNEHCRYCKSFLSGR